MLIEVDLTGCHLPGVHVASGLVESALNLELSQLCLYLLSYVATLATRRVVYDCHGLACEVDSADLDRLGVLLDEGVEGCLHVSFLCQVLCAIILRWRLVASAVWPHQVRKCLSFSVSSLLYLVWQE